MLQIAALCCNGLRFAAACCSVLLFIALCGKGPFQWTQKSGVLQCVVVCCSVLGCGLLQRVAVCCCLLRFVAKALFNGLRKAVCYSVL